jgi:hypothetical protein
MSRWYEGGTNLCRKIDFKSFQVVGLLSIFSAQYTAHQMEAKSVKV